MRTPTRWRRREVPRLAEMRLQALELRIDADLHLGRHVEVIAELRWLTGAHPLREHLHAQLMLALYRDGRPGGGAGRLPAARRLLVDELGIEPGARLRELHQRMLAADPALAAPRARPAVTDGPGLMVPASWEGLSELWLLVAVPR